MEQLSLFGEKPLSRFEADRLFFAFLADEKVVRASVALHEELRQRFALRSRRRPEDTLHVSVLYLGSFPGADELVDPARTAAAAIDKRPFALSFGEVMSFRARPGSNRPLVLAAGDGAMEMRRLCDGLCRELAGRGIRLRRPPAVAHLTLCYEPVAVPTIPLRRPIRFEVRELTLVRSLMGRHRYEILGSWPLRRAATEPLLWDAAA